MWYKFCSKISSGGSISTDWFGGEPIFIFNMTDLVLRVTWSGSAEQLWEVNVHGIPRDDVRVHFLCTDLVSVRVCSVCVRE